jgi:hypothetical protein
MNKNKGFELDEIKEWLEFQAYTSGLDDCEYSNLLRGWFKHGGLREMILFKLDLKEADKNNKSNKTLALIDSILGVLEGILREELREYAQDHERSREKVQNFVIGLGIGHYLRAGSLPQAKS